MKQVVFFHFFRMTLAQTTRLVVLLSSIAVFAMLGRFSYEHYTARVTQIETDAQKKVALLAKAQERLAQETQKLLTVVVQATAACVQEKGVAGFFPYFKKKQFGDTNFFLADNNGLVVATTGEDTSTHIAIGDKLYYTKNKEKNAVVAGEVTFSRQSGAPILYYGHQLLLDDGQEFLLGIGLHSQSSQKIVSENSFPEGSRVYIADSQGKIALSWPALSRGGLPSLPAKIYQSIQNELHDTGFFYLPSREGKTLIAFERLRLSEKHAPCLFVILTYPEELIRSAAKKVLYQELIGIALGFFTSLTIGAFAAVRYVSLPVSHLVEKANAIFAGDEGRLNLACLCIKELQVLGVSFNELAAAKDLKEKSLQSAVEHVERAAYEKTQFLANMSHEIRTPMNAIIGMAYLTLQEPLAIYQKEYLRTIHGSGQQLLQVVNDILELSKLNMALGGNENIKFSLRDMIIEVRHRFSSFAAEKGISLILSVDPSVPQQVEGNPLRLGQVIGHLVDNAIRYSRRGVVEIACGNEETTENAVVINISVKDHGCGLSPQKRLAVQRMLDERNPILCESVYFSRKSLGLLLAQRILLLMGGWLSVESEEGMGSIFSAHIPLRTCALDISNRYAESLQGMRVLAVDDDDISLGIVAELLRQFGMRVDTTMAPADAACYIKNADAQKDPYRFILLDWKMPGYDGLELCKEIKQHLKLASHPSILVVSAFGAGLPEIMKQRAGADAFLHKPLNQSVLFDTIVHLLQTQSYSISLAFQSDLVSLRQKLEGLSVLLVEDNLINQQIAVDLLKSARVNLAIASDGEEGLAHFLSLPAKPPFDIVLTDLQMPRLSGYEMCRKIRRLGVRWASDIPIIAMTAHSRNSELGDFAASGLSDYVGKPIAVEDLYRAMQRWLPVTAIIDKNICSVAYDLHKLCTERQLLPVFSLLKEATGLLEPFFGEGRIKCLRDIILSGRFDLATAFLERLDEHAQFMRRGKK